MMDNNNNNNNNALPTKKKSREQVAVVAAALHSLPSPPFTHIRDQYSMLDNACPHPNNTCSHGQQPTSAGPHHQMHVGATSGATAQQPPVSGAAAGAAEEDEDLFAVPQMVGGNMASDTDSTDSSDSFNASLIRLLPARRSIIAESASIDDRLKCPNELTSNIAAGHSPSMLMLRSISTPEETRRLSKSNVQYGPCNAGSIQAASGSFGASSVMASSKCRNYSIQGMPSTSSSIFGRKHSFEYGAAKHLHTELLVSKHTLKSKMSKFQRLIDRSVSLVSVDDPSSVNDGCSLLARVLKNSWTTAKVGSDLAHGLCNYIRDCGFLDTLLHILLNPRSTEQVRLSACFALVECLSSANREYVVVNNHLEELVNVCKTMKEGEKLRASVSLLECLFKYSVESNGKLIELGALDHVLAACKVTTCRKTLRVASLALANLSMYSDSECQQKMIAKNVPDWLFLLASSQDDVTRYYACLAICALVSNKEIESAVTKSGTLALVEPFLLAHKPEDFSQFDYKHQQGRSKEWLELLTPMLSAKRREPRSMAAFHFALEASVKKEQEALSVLLEIGAVDVLKQVASMPDEVAPKFASQALQIIGEKVPYKLSQQVPFWSVDDVQYWVSQIGFEKYCSQFHEQKVDGDLLLLLTDMELERDIGMQSGLLRKRFMRELESLKMAADYSSIDETHLDRFLVNVSPQFSVYTYQLLELGVDRSTLPSISNEMLKSECGIVNPVHRMKLMQSIEDCKHVEDLDIAILSKHIDIFVSYRRSTGSQLASLIKVLLQLRGHKVFIDVDRLYAGNFDSSLLKNIQAAKHFVLVLTPRSLDRCLQDVDCEDWVHREVKCALEHNKNVIPVFDPNFEWPDENQLPADIRAITRFNGVRWVHEYQEACVDKLEKFINGELNVNRGFFPLPQYGSFSRNVFANAAVTQSSINVSGSSSTDLDNSILAPMMSYRGRMNGSRSSSCPTAIFGNQLLPAGLQQRRLELMPYKDNAEHV